MNMMEQIMSEMRGRQNGQMNGSAAQQMQQATTPCGCAAARANVQRAGIVVKVTGRPPEQQAAKAARAVRQQPQRPQQYGPRGGFGGGVRGAPPELQSGTLIKVDKKPANLMDEILAGLRNRK